MCSLAPSLLGFVGERGVTRLVRSRQLMDMAYDTKRASQSLSSGSYPQRQSSRLAASASASPASSTRGHPSSLASSWSIKEEFAFAKGFNLFNTDFHRIQKVLLHDKAVAELTAYFYAHQLWPQVVASQLVAPASHETDESMEDANRSRRRRSSKPTNSPLWCSMCCSERTATVQCSSLRCRKVICRSCYAQAARLWDLRFDPTWDAATGGCFWLCDTCLPRSESLEIIESPWLDDADSSVSGGGVGAGAGAGAGAKSSDLTGARRKQAVKRSREWYVLFWYHRFSLPTVPDRVLRLLL